MKAPALPKLVKHSAVASLISVATSQVRNWVWPKTRNRPAGLAARRAVRIVHESIGRQAHQPNDPRDNLHQTKTHPA